MQNESANSFVSMVRYRLRKMKNSIGVQQILEKIQSIQNILYSKIKLMFIMFLSANVKYTNK